MARFRTPPASPASGPRTPDPQTPSATIVALAERVNRPAADLVFLSCTSLNVAQEIGRIERVIGKPVVTSNQASAWLLMQRRGMAPRPDFFGALMTKRREPEVSV